MDLNDVVTVIGGTYEGKQGVVVKITAKMVVVRLREMGIEVRVLQNNVEVTDGFRTSTPSQLPRVQQGMKAELVVQEHNLVAAVVKQELISLRKKIDGLVELLERTQISYMEVI